jgi:hypothetical protein
MRHDIRNRHLQDSINYHINKLPGESLSADGMADAADFFFLCHKRMYQEISIDISPPDND